MIKRVIGVIAACVLLLGAVGHADQPLRHTLASIVREDAVYADLDLTEMMGTLSEGAVVYVGDAPAGRDGVSLIQFVYPFILREGYIASDALLALEGDALADYLNTAADGMMTEGFPLLPVVFTAGTAAPAASDAQTRGPDGQSLVRIVSQPQDRKGKVGQTVTFELEAYGVQTYCWQFHNGRVWKNCTLPGCQGPAMRVEVTERRLNYHYRCILTDANGNSVFTNEVGFVK